MNRSNHNILALVGKAQTAHEGSMTYETLDEELPKFLVPVL
jgi:hypothetical protein